MEELLKEIVVKASVDSVERYICNPVKCKIEISIRAFFIIKIKTKY